MLLHYSRCFKWKLELSYNCSCELGCYLVNKTMAGSKLISCKLLSWKHAVVCPALALLTVAATRQHSGYSLPPIIALLPVAIACHQQRRSNTEAIACHQLLSISIKKAKNWLPKSSMKSENIWSTIYHTLSWT